LGIVRTEFNKKCHDLPNAIDINKLKPIIREKEEIHEEKTVRSPIILSPANSNKKFENYSPQNSLHKKKHQSSMNKSKSEEKRLKPRPFYKQKQYPLPRKTFVQPK